MNTQKLDEAERKMLLEMARQAIELAVNGRSLPPLDIHSLPSPLQEEGASFVTLTKHGDLRGCIGALEPYQPLADDVREHAVAAALEDYRFGPVSPDEVKQLEIEISRLTRPIPLEYERPEDLPGLLHPGVDGVVIKDGMRRATFLPQVWEKIPDPVDFLEQLCMKMGVYPDHWRKRKLQVLLYTVEEFHE